MINKCARDLLHIDESRQVTRRDIAAIIGFDPAGSRVQKQKESTINGEPYTILSVPLMIDGLMSGTVVYVRDFSMMKEAEDIKTDFVSIASHELRNPLTSLKNAVNILLNMNEQEIVEHKDRFLSIATRNVDRINGLINQYLDITRIEMGKMPFEFNQVALKPFVDNLIHEFSYSAEEKSILVQSDISDSVPTVLADAPKLEEILYNLIGNALKHTEQHGTITVNAHELPSNGACDSDSPMVRVVVADTGCGIPDDKKDLIFTKFYRVQSSAEINGEGVGLGLAIVQKLVEMHGGCIHVEDNTPRGCRFCFTLPVHSRERRDPAFRWVFDRELYAARKSHQSLSLIAIVLDNFKQVEMSAAKDETDAFLAESEEVIKKSLFRQTDVVVHRKERDMFVVFCHADSSGASAITDRIESNLRSSAVKWGKTAFESIRFRAGFAAYPQEAENQRDLFRIALKKLQGA
jgi:diguanylate cyclase (GGDEF)-like protein